MSGEGVHNPANLIPLEADIAALVADVADLDADVVLLQADVTDIMAVTDGLPTLTSMVGTTTTTLINTEYNLYINNAPMGVYEPKLVTVNFLNQTAAETVILRVYRRDTNGGVWSLFDESAPYAGVIAPVLVGVSLGPNRYGIRVTIERTAGSARDYPWSAFYEL